jgi:broad specificity phosphatase PhoE
MTGRPHQRKRVPCALRPAIYLGRHCKTAWNLEGRIQGSVDRPLCAEGRAEASALLHGLGNYRFDRIVSSPYRRALETARVFADGLAIPLETHPGLRELHHGAWEGQRLEPLLQEPGSAFRQWMQNPSRIDIPEGPETVAEAQARIVRAVRETARAHAGSTILMVLHKHIRALLKCHLNRCRLAAFSAFIDESIAPEPITTAQMERLFEPIETPPPVSGRAAAQRI